MANENFYQKFLNDLELGKDYEVYVAKLFEEKGFKTLGYNNDKMYDIIMQNQRCKQRTIEVKYDRIANTGGNIVFEYLSYGKPSGIESTKSDYFVYVYPLMSQVWIMKTKKIKKMIEFYNPVYCADLSHCFNTTATGDNKSTRCYYWKQSVFKEIVGDDLIILNRNDIP